MPLACSRLHFKVQHFATWLPESAICDKLRNMNLCVNCPIFCCHVDTFLRIISCYLK
uniref:Uncharacterized protein n=1 Tax=Anguilla anguilla TaxID=7936 RepID=A0A0E9PZW1_ANGAN